MQLTIEKDKIFLQFPFAWDTVDKVKSLKIMAWNKNLKKWHCDNNAINRQIISEKLPETGLKTENQKTEMSEINNVLMQHQKDGVITAIKNRRHAFWYDTGTGKTLMSLEIIRQLKVKTLIITPLSIINAWIEDCQKFYPDMKIINLWELNKKKENIRFDNQIYIINYELFRIFAKKVNFAEQGFRGLILDESTKIKNPSAITSKEVIKLADNMDYLFSLSATPAPNSIMEYWSQIRLLNPTKWGKSFYKWKLQNFIQEGYGGFTWVIRDKATEQRLLSDVASVSSSVRKEDVLDLPERTFRIRSVQFSDNERKAYIKMSKDLYIAISSDSGVSAANAAVKIGKLRQITAGFVIDTKSGSCIDLGESKLNELSDLLDEIGKKQVLIWTQYQYEAVRIAKMFDNQGRTYGICNGTVSQGKQDKAISEFKSDNIQYLIAHPQSIGHGITLINCSYAVYFSRSYSYQEQYQSQDRIYRYGQKNQCSYFFLDAENSIDGIIRTAVDEKKKLNEVFIDYFKTN